MQRKLCECGCRKPAPIATKTNRAQDYVKGVAMRFIQGHHIKGANNPNYCGTLVERFWRHVNKNGQMPSISAAREHPEIARKCCWEWTASTNAQEYGTIMVEGNSKLAHRVAWFLETGQRPEPCALHKCDNTKCVRLLHLFEGTNGDNVENRVHKHRSNKPKHRDNLGRFSNDNTTNG